MELHLVEYSEATVALSPQRVTAHCTLGFTHSHTHLQTVTQTNIYAVDIYTQPVRVDISVKSQLMLLCSPVYMVKGSMPPRRVAKLLCTPDPSPGRRDGPAAEPVLREFATVLHIAAAPHTAQQLRAGRVRTANGVRAAAVFRGLLHCQHIHTSYSQVLATK